MLGSLILYLKGMRIMMFQLSGFYCISKGSPTFLALEASFFHQWSTYFNPEPISCYDSQPSHCNNRL